MDDASLRRARPRLKSRSGRPAPHPLFGASREPLYAQLADVFRLRIETGEWAHGDTLPSLERLMESFSVSRVTVRQAVRLLADEGLLAPRRGSGTLVTGYPSSRRTLSVETTLARLVDMYRDDRPSLDNLDEGIVDTLPDGAEPPFADSYFRLRRTHSRDEVPYCVITLYIDLPIFRRAERRFREELVLPVLTSLEGLIIGAAEQRLTVVGLDLESARLLGLAPGSPGAHVRRVLRHDSGEIVYFADVVYRGDFVHLDMDLRA